MAGDAVPTDAAPAALVGGWAANCMMQAQETCLAVSGVNIANRIGSPIPTTLSAAKALLRSRQVRTVRAFMTGTFGAPIPARLARRGDIALLGSGFGIVIGRTAIFQGGEAALRDVTTIWTVHHG